MHTIHPSEMTDDTPISLTCDLRVLVVIEGVGITTKSKETSS